MLILAGLGNPGPKHAGNRHNIGFMAADEIARRHGFRPVRPQFHSQVAEGTIAGEKIVLLKPKTFMNESGRALFSALRLYKLKARDAIVIHDDLDLAPGKMRVKRGGGPGGHNGLRSIDSRIGRDYRRIRMGIGHPGNKAMVHGYVLRDFDRDELSGVERAIEAVAEALPLLIEGDDNAFMTRYAVLNPPPKKPKPERPKRAETEESADGKATETG